MLLSSRSISKLLASIALFLVPAATCLGHSPLGDERKRQLVNAPDLPDRIARMKRGEPYRLGAGLAERAIYKITRTLLQNSDLPIAEQHRLLYSGPLKRFPFEAQPALRSVGSVRMLVVLIDFPDHPGGISREEVEQSFFGLDVPGAKPFFPYESLRQYYRRASERRLDIIGTVLGWIRMPKNRSEYEPKYQPGMDQGDREAVDQKALFELMTSALKAASANYNFSQFDNDRDGDIDLVHVIYAGPNTGWGGFWWAYQWRFEEALAKTRKIGGKKLAQFIFQFVEERGSQGFDPQTAIHEIGHALGLPDLYDYQVGVGPDGGVGGLDMMDGNMGNHNALSRWLLDWITPTVVQSDVPATYSLAPSGGGKPGIKALAIFPG